MDTTPALTRELKLLGTEPASEDRAPDQPDIATPGVSGQISVVDEPIQEPVGFTSVGPPETSEDEYIGYYFLPTQVDDAHAYELPAKSFRKRGYRGRGGGRAGSNRSGSAPLEPLLGVIPEFTEGRQGSSKRGVRGRGASGRSQILRRGNKEDSTW